jgi:hypothetical protein
MSQSFDDIKLKLAEFARLKDKRDVGFFPDDPSKWWPGNVTDPRSGEPFTVFGAWEFIAEELEKKKTIIKEVVLKKPVGKPGYEFCVDTEFGEIYIKVRLTRDRIIGRSFHYSENKGDL